MDLNDEPCWVFKWVMVYSQLTKKEWKSVIYQIHLTVRIIYPQLKKISFFILFFKKHFSDVKNLLYFEKSGKVKAAAKCWLRVHRWMDWVSGGWIIIGYWCFCCCSFRKGKSVILSLLQTDTRSAKQKQGKLSFLWRLSESIEYCSFFISFNFTNHKQLIYILCSIIIQILSLSLFSVDMNHDDDVGNKKTRITY